jgi:RNA polymerase sigma-70 factor (ECF subfamily)
LADDAPRAIRIPGHAAIRRFIGHAFGARWDRPHRLVPTRANTQPAFGHYVKDTHSDIGRAVGLVVLTLDDDRISHITRFAATSALPHFGLPRTIPW